MLLTLSNSGRTFMGKKTSSNNSGECFECGKQTSNSSVMPLRFDDTTISGLFDNDGYVWIGDRDPKAIGKLILQRLAIADETKNLQLVSLVQCFLWSRRLLPPLTEIVGA